MNFISRLFNTKKVDCPRCLGKGNVDLQDIKRLNRELYWSPGKCAYCNGIGKVSHKIATSVSAEIAYLTTDISKHERNKLLKGEVDALQRAKQFEEEVDKEIKLIEHLFYIENLESDQIAQYLLSKYGRKESSSAEKQELVEYIERVIKSKLSK